VPMRFTKAPALAELPLPLQAALGAEPERVQVVQPAVTRQIAGGVVEQFVSHRCVDLLFWSDGATEVELSRSADFQGAEPVVTCALGSEAGSGCPFAVEPAPGLPPGAWVLHDWPLCEGATGWTCAPGRPAADAGCFAPAPTSAGPAPAPRAHEAALQDEGADTADTTPRAPLDSKRAVYVRTVRADASSGSRYEVRSAPAALTVTVDASPPDVQAFVGAPLVSAGADVKVQLTGSVADLDATHCPDLFAVPLAALTAGSPPLSTAALPPGSLGPLPLCSAVRGASAAECQYCFEVGAAAGLSGTTYRFVDGDYGFFAELVDHVGNPGRVLPEVPADPASRRTLHVDASRPVLSNAATIRQALEEREELVQQAPLAALVTGAQWQVELELDEPVCEFQLSVNAEFAVCSPLDEPTPPPSGTACTAPAYDRYRCSFSANQDTGDGARAIRVQGKDSSGNRLDQELGTLTFDSNRPNATGVLSRRSGFPSAVVRGSVRTVWFSAFEPETGAAAYADLVLLLDKALRTDGTPRAPTVELVAAGRAGCDDAAPVSAVLQPAASSTGDPRQYQFSLNLAERAGALGAAAAEVEYCLRVRFSDARGAQVQWLKDRLGFARASSTPSGIDLERSVFRRAPWGTEGGPARFSVAVELGPAAGSPRGFAPSHVVISGNAQGSQRLAMAQLAGGAGRSAEVVLKSSFDAAQLSVFAAVVDQAGNVSQFEKIVRGQWTAPVGVGGPLVAEGWGNAPEVLYSGHLGQALAANELARGDGVTAKTHATVAWQRLAGDSASAALSPSGRVGFAVAYDNARGVTWLFGGVSETLTGEGLPTDNRLWEWNGTRWSVRDPDVGGHWPTPRTNHRLVYDPVRDRVVLFGGWNTEEFYPGTWEWDPAREIWLELESDDPNLRDPSQPPPRFEPAVGFDPVTQRVVLTGGVDENFHALDDTWTWDGRAWTSHEPAAAPAEHWAARSRHAMAFADAGDGRRGLLLFGGESGRDRLGRTVTLGDTWLWNGSTWQRPNPAQEPLLRAGHSLASDNLGRVWLFGGTVSGGDDEFAEPDLSVRVWNGENWVVQSGITQPCLGVEACNLIGVFEPAHAQFHLFGDAEYPEFEHPGEWLFDALAGDWSELGTVGPPNGPNAGMVYLPALRASVLVVDNRETDPARRELEAWLLRGQQWEKLEFTPGDPKPPPGIVTRAGCEPPQCTSAERINLITVDDASALLLGRAADPAQPASSWLLAPAASGADATGASRQWSWREVPATATCSAAAGPLPSALGAGALALALASADSEANARAFWFGGQSSETPYSSGLFAWSGGCWQELATDGPAPRTLAALTTLDGHTLTLFGGFGPREDLGLASGVWGDTWSWDGQTWNQLVPPVSPAARQAHTLTRVSADRAFLIGGARNQAPLADVWQWNGETWRDVRPAGNELQLPARALHSAAYDEARGRAVVFGGQGLGDTWTMQPPGKAAQSFRFSVENLGCASSNAAPTSTSTGLAIQELAFRASASGSGGVQFSVWNGTQWQPKLSLEGPGTQPVNWQGRGREVTGAGRSFGFQLRSRTASGRDVAELETDVAEVRVDYVLLDSPDGSSGTLAGATSGTAGEGPRYTCSALP
jgi:hypothetical protein